MRMREISLRNLVWEFLQATVNNWKKKHKIQNTNRLSNSEESDETGDQIKNIQNYIHRSLLIEQ